jgi:transglutaminase-like putative cysteine protease
MRVSIGHVSRYTYDSPATYAIQTLRLTPPSFAGQQVRNWSITAPGFAKATTFRDSYGNAAHLVTFTERHSDSIIIAKGVVDTEDRAGVVQGLIEAAPLRTYLRHTVNTTAGERVRALAEIAAAQHNLDRFHTLMGKVREAVAYTIGVTSANTTAEEALDIGHGVCQDHAHVFIAAARLLGSPARYVNGYFVSGSDEASEAHHAWAEVYLENLGWVGFDPANGLCPDERYVRLATGLDAASSAPIRGTRRGGVGEVLDVIVDVQQASCQQ